MVGREVEVDLLTRVVKGARTGRSSCTFLLGEGGLGKSRLLGEVVAASRRAGVAVAVGRAGIAGPAPFGLVAEAIRSWLRGHPVVLEPSAFDHGLRLILPEWDASGAERGDLAAGQLRLLALEAVVRLLREIASAGGGAVLILDDLHAGDPDSMELVRYVASAAVEGLAVVATIRPGESELADDLVRALRVGVAAESIELEPLGSREVRDLVSALLEAAPPPELIADVLARTDGLPFFVEEVVDAHLRAGSVLVEAGSARWRGGAVVMPRSVREMAQRRLDRLRHPARDVLLALAVVDSSERSHVLAAVSDVDEPSVWEALRLGVEAGLLTTAAGVTRYRHDLIREAVLDGAARPAVAAMHRRAAAALANDPDLARRATHLAEAGADNEAAQVFAEAAVTARDSYALLDAERLARRAIDLAGTAETSTAGADALAGVLAAQGRWAEALEIDESTVGRTGDDPARCHRVAEAALEAGLPQRAADALSRCTEDLPLHRLLAGRLALVGGDATTALAQADAVLAEPVDVDTRLTALDIRARALDFFGERAAAAQSWSDQASEAGGAGRTQTRLRALLQLGKQEFFTGGRPLRLREAVEVAAEAGALLELAWAEETLAIALTLQGDPAGALEVLEPAVARARAMCLDQLGFLLVAQAGALSFTQASGEALLAEAEAISPAPDLRMFTGTIRADIAMRSGRYEDAIAHFETAELLAASMPGAAPVDPVCQLVWALAAIGRTDEARAALARASQMPDLARWYPRPVLVAAGRALLAGDAAGVDDAIAAAGGPMPFDVATMRTIGASVLGGATSVAWLREALNIYEATGATAYRERARRLLRDAGGPVPRRRAAATGVPAELASRGVTARETEVLRLLGQGLSNADIAAELFLSVRTVETHVSSLLTKLALRGRGNLIALSSTLPNDA
jgi:DNA-binding CsgD family transcriptional regulator